MNTWLSFLATEKAQISDTTVLSFGEQPADYQTLVASTTISPLTDRGALQVSGPDTDKLLQGQLTCDMKQLEIGASQPGAICDTKGRMISSFTLIRTAADRVLLAMHHGLVATTLQTLKKYAVFYKTELRDASDDFLAIGLNGEFAAQPDCLLATISPSRALLLAPAAQAAEIWQTLNQSHTATGVHFWEYLSIQDGLGEVRPETSEEFIPQMLNFQHTGAVSFRKGCYTGQEIVARMQYLGKLKRRLYHLRIDGNQQLQQPGTSIQNPDGASVGTVVLAQRSGETSQDLLAVLTQEAAHAKQLQFGEIQASVELLPLPYDDKFAEARA